eukprot:119853-Chlamydomonas_euryale.AAC.6
MDAVPSNATGSTLQSCQCAGISVSSPRGGVDSLRILASQSRTNFRAAHSALTARAALRSRVRAARVATPRVSRRESASAPPTRSP